MKQRLPMLALSLLLGFLALLPAHAQNDALSKALMAPLPPDTEIEAIVIKFRDEAGVRMGASGKLMQNAQKASLPAAAQQNALRSSMAKIEGLAKSSGLQLRRHFAAHSEVALDEWVARGKQLSKESLSDLNSFYSMRVPPGTRFSQVAALADALSKHDFVEVAYAEPVPRNSQIATPSFEASQGYLGLPPNGIDARYGWSLPGGLGTGVRLVDVEYSWNVFHEDFPPVWRSSGNFNNVYGDDHGTAVAGVLAAPHNGFGVSGIAPGMMFGVRSVTNSVSVAEGIQWAATTVGTGGIILIEQQRAGPGTTFDCACSQDQCNLVPVEYGSAAYSAIRAATANGIVVVEAAGNGSVDLDSPFYFGVFDRNERDSRAIIVGAGHSSVRGPTCFTNYGSRIDVHGWGESVMTTGYWNLLSLDPPDHNRLYTPGFGGTSSASPIVAGAVAIIQGIRMAEGQPTLSPVGMRYVLNSTGTPQTVDLARPIGPLPNVRAAIVASGSGPPPPDLPWLPAILNLLLGD